MNYSTYFGPISATPGKLRASTKFDAWGDGVPFAGIRLQSGGVTPGQYRQMIAIDREQSLPRWNPIAVTTVARQCPKSILFFGDEPDGTSTRKNGSEAPIISVDLYAYMYDGFVKAAKAGNPNAKVSPGGLTNDSGFLNGYPNPTPNFTYASKFYEINNVDVDEWRFHTLFSPGRVDDWLNITLPALVHWVKLHPKPNGQPIPLVIGSFIPVNHTEPKKNVAESQVAQALGLVMDGIKR